MTLGDRFGAFFAAANDGLAPYPWQVELVERIAAAGTWPHIAAPTGAGKSAVVDVHVFLVAEHAAGALAVRPPRRLALVAPRRVLVDDQ
jgi:CRISPR-associated endonuclease/helicase Cas3